MPAIIRSFLVTALLIVTLSWQDVAGQDQGKKAQPKKTAEAVSFKKDVFPIITRQCLPCHAEDNFNPSELSLDTYDLLMAGGKHGSPVTSGKAEESLLVKKLSEKPPFGDRMPLNTKKKIEQGKAKWLSEEEVSVIISWIEQGAKHN